MVTARRYVSHECDDDDQHETPPEELSLSRRCTQRNGGCPSSSVCTGNLAHEEDLAEQLVVRTDEHDACISISHPDERQEVYDCGVALGLYATQTKKSVVADGCDPPMPEVPMEKTIVTPDGAPPAPYWKLALATFKIYWSLILGNILEWYEFSAYGYLIPEIRANFFEGSSSLAWVGFGLTFLMRPLGGILIGWVSDRFGRRVGTTISLAGMLAATVIQGFLPSAILNKGTVLPTLGVGLLLTCRMLQGVFAGGEICGISVTLGEHQPQDCLAFASSFIMTGAALAFSLSSGVVCLLHLTLTREQMLLWGWRIPFLLPLVPGLAALLLRMKMPETTAFLELTHTETGLKHFLKTLRRVCVDYRGVSLICIGGTACKAVATYMGPIYTCDFVTKHLGVSSATSLGVGCITQLVTIIFCPLMACICDRIGIGKVMLIGAVYVAVTGIPVYALLVEVKGDHTPLVIAAAVIFGLGEAITSSAIFLWTLELFETSLRTTGMGLSYNFSMALFGGFAPVIADVLATNGFLYAPGLMISVAGVISAVTVAISRVLYHQNKITLAHIRPKPY